MLVHEGAHLWQDVGFESGDLVSLGLLGRDHRRVGVLRGLVPSLFVQGLFSMINVPIMVSLMPLLLFLLMLHHNVVLFLWLRKLRKQNLTAKVVIPYILNIFFECNVDHLPQVFTVKARDNHAAALVGLRLLIQCHDDLEVSLQIKRDAFNSGLHKELFQHVELLQGASVLNQIVVLQRCQV